MLYGTDSWFWEIVAAIVSCVAELSLVFVLRHIDRKPQASWTFNFTPNTVISLLATTARSSCLLTISAVIGQQKWVWYGIGSSRAYPDIQDS
ncbi:MAG: hypothetical protein CL912_17555 [Deltaproteobacteria bacterium]|nr:hypothetical protein [Deltaproteobacteria bacterium]